jgi:uroporphyrinogen-III decarboxylase
MAEDDVQLISPALLTEFVVPALKKLRAGLTCAEQIKLHICGDGTRHFRTLRDELGAYEFDTGFPIDFGKLRRELGPDVTIWGGPNVMILKDGSPDQVAQETTRILDSGICEGGRFVLREGNNLALHTPLANLSTMYEAAKSWGRKNLDLAHREGKDVGIPPN